MVAREGLGSTQFPKHLHRPPQFTLAPEHEPAASVSFRARIKSQQVKAPPCIASRHASCPRPPAGQPLDVPLTSPTGSRQAFPKYRAGRTRSGHRLAMSPTTASVPLCSCRFAGHARRLGRHPLGRALELNVGQIRWPEIPSSTSTSAAFRAPWRRRRSRLRLGHAARPGRRRGPSRGARDARRARPAPGLLRPPPRQTRAKRTTMGACRPWKP